MTLRIEFLPDVEPVIHPLKSMAFKLRSVIAYDHIPADPWQERQVVDTEYNTKILLSRERASQNGSRIAVPQEAGIEWRIFRLGIEITQIDKSIRKRVLANSG